MPLALTSNMIQFIWLCYGRNTEIEFKLHPDGILLTAPTGTQFLVVF